MDVSLFDSIPNEISQLLVSFSGSVQSISDIIASYKDAMKKNKIEVLQCRLAQIFHFSYPRWSVFKLNYPLLYLRCHGFNVKDHPILRELERLTACLKRCQNICSKQSTEINHSRLDKEASKRFVKRALWQSAQSKAKKRRIGGDN